MGSVAEDSVCDDVVGLLFSTHHLVCDSTNGVSGSGTVINDQHQERLRRCDKLRSRCRVDGD